MAHPPNVVLCLSDMMRSFAVGCYGNDHVQTPHLDRLAAEGVRFDVAVTNNPLCTPARSCLLTGQHSRTCMAASGNTNALWPSAERNRLSSPTLAECFKHAGYTTGLIGKWHLEPDPLRCGFDTALYPNIIHRHYGQQYVEDTGTPFTVDEFAPDFEAKRLDNFIETRRGERFFLFHNISQPHMPVGPGNCPDHYLDMYDKSSVPLRPNALRDGKPSYDPEWFITYTNPDYWYRMWQGEAKRPTDTVPDDYDLRDLTAQYYALVSCADDQVGALMRSLEAHGVAGDTIVIFVSDHGDNLGSHGEFNKQLLIEESIRVPLIAWWPEHLQPHVNETRVAQIIDIMPTLLDLCGLDIPESVQGHSLAPIVRDGRDAIHAENAAYIETPSGMIGIRTPTHLYGMRTNPETHEILDERFQFFDLTGDPYEMSNLACTNEQESVASELRNRLCAWHTETRWMDT